MTRPWSPLEVEERITEVITKLDEHVTALPEIAEEAGHAKVAYEIAFAKALLVAREDGSVKSADERKALATVAVERELRAKQTTEDRYDTHKRVIAVLSDQGRLLQTLSVSRRAVEV